MKLFAKLGFLIHPEKSVLVPSQHVSNLGYNVDSLEMLVTLGDDKTNNALNLCHEALQCATMTIRHLARIIGTLISLFPACPLGRAHYRSLEMVKLEALNRNRWNWEANCCLFGQAVNDLQWWVRILPATAANIQLNRPQATLYTDASSHSWGAWFQGVFAQGKFDPNQKELHINTKEVFAVYYGIRVFLPYFSGDHLLVRTDNTTALATVRDMGTLSSPQRNAIAQKIWNVMQDRDTWLSINFVPGLENRDADLASRLINLRTEWALPVLVFRDLAFLFGCPTVDLFASRLNKKLNRYVSWAPNPFCIEVDAFFFHWQHEYPYIYPPFNLLKGMFTPDVCVCVCVNVNVKRQEWVQTHSVRLCLRFY